MGDRLKDKLIQFINNPYDLNINLDLGFLYEEQSQLASAVSHYLRGAEYGLDNLIENKKLLITECLLRASVCMDKLGGRNYSTKGLVLHSISHSPSLPQVYLQMSKVYETTGEWGECNAMCSSGIELIDLYQNLRYDSRTKEQVLNELLYQKAVSDYYIGKTNKARIDLLKLRRKSNLENWILAAIDKSLNSIGYPTKFNQVNYHSSSNLSNSPIFKENSFVSYSYSLKDVFVSTLIKRVSGTYLEIGFTDPVVDSSTNLLEKDYIWRGVSVSDNSNIVNKFNSTRRNKAILSNPSTTDYRQILAAENMPSEIGYLQLDFEPVETSLSALKIVPFNDYKFGIITFKHNFYKSNPNVRDESRKFLEQMGYELLITDVSHNCLQSFEDWWVHPEVIKKYISREKLDLIKYTSSQPKCILDIFL